ncbi:Acetate kinase [Acidisarcina polymorpha]|uniref:Acetate kinase n=1 Tax=Acidisarcina polymorpha TaxID=2211140 RepID=A0A2Z5FXX2_9BACT|nr:acetate/propionate family kinase [Acidisarcina polymorpha]AXC11317.1 Acetate kinase [Acidisarcina polymorpha]
MPIILALNPGSNSLKFDLVEVHDKQQCASLGDKLLSGNIDDIGKKTTLKLIRDGEQIAETEGDFGDFHQATEQVIHTLETADFERVPKLEGVDLAAVRVVHGGDSFTAAVKFTDDVARTIESHEKLAPLHNANSLEIIRAVQKKAPTLPIGVAFDTAFHHSLPEHAWRYPIERKLADRYGIRKYGFHGLSHLYMLEQYAHLTSRPPDRISAVTMHLESGSSVAAIQNGESVDTSMGFTPLEGLMMGTRCGSIDAAIVGFLIKEAQMTADEVMKVLEKESGLLGISGKSLDTRILRKSNEEASKLALEMFGYRARQFVGASLATLGEAEALIFGGGIGENTPEVRLNVCDGLKGWGVVLDEDKNWATSDGDVLISDPSSKIAIWVIHSEEGLQLAHECAHI